MECDTQWLPDTKRRRLPPPPLLHLLLHAVRITVHPVCLHAVRTGALLTANGAAARASQIPRIW